MRESHNHNHHQGTQEYHNHNSWDNPDNCDTWANHNQHYRNWDNHNQNYDNWDNQNQHYDSNNRLMDMGLVWP